MEMFSSESGQTSKFDAEMKALENLDSKNTVVISKKEFQVKNMAFIQ
jgi:hypothetical protein